MPKLVTLRDIQEASERCRGIAFHTPLVPFLPDPTAGPRELLLKAESLQPTGAFKLRGAYNKIALTLPQAREFGIVAHSSGNHARAVAWVARLLGLRAVIVMPDSTPAAKVAATRALGAKVVIVTPEQRDTRAFELAEEYGYVHIPPYDDPSIIAGQGTVGLEIVKDCPDVDVVLVPVSGGGLIGGIATAVKSLAPNVKVVGVEPELAADAAESFRTGVRTQWDTTLTYRTVADGLRTTCVGELPWRQIERYVDDIIVVTDDEIRDTMGRLALEARMVAEPSGAVSAAAYFHRSGELPSGSKYVAVVSGGNVDPALLSDAVLRRSERLIAEAPS